MVAPAPTPRRPRTCATIAGLRGDPAACAGGLKREAGDAAARGHPGTAPATVSETRRGNTPLKAATVHRTGRRRAGEATPARESGDRPRSRLVAARRASRRRRRPGSLHATLRSLPSACNSRPPLACGRARRRAHMTLRTDTLAIALATSLALPATAAAQTTDL